MLVAPFAGSQAVAQTHNLTGTASSTHRGTGCGCAVVIDRDDEGYLDGFPTVPSH